MFSRRSLLKAFALVPAAALVPSVVLGQPFVQQPNPLIELLEARIKQAEKSIIAGLEEIVYGPSSDAKDGLAGLTKEFPEPHKPRYHPPRYEWKTVATTITLEA